MTNELSIRITANGGQLKAELANAAASVRQFASDGVSASEHVNTGFGKTRAGVMSISEKLAQIRQELIGFFGIQMASGMVSDLSGVADSMTKASAQLTLATKSQVEYNQASADLFEIAQRNQAPLQAAVTLFSRLAPAIRESGGTSVQAMLMTQGFSDALKIGGASATESASAMLQFSQAMASGVMRGDEFNSVNEASPRIMKALADGIGVPVGALRTMAEEGKLTSDVVGNALLSQVQKLRAEAAGMPKTIGGGMTEVRNEFARLVGDLDKANGISSSVSGTLSTLAANLDKVAAVAVMVAGVFAARMAGALAAYIKKQMEAVAASIANRNAALAEAAALEEKHRRLVMLNAANSGLSSALRTQAAEAGVAATAARAHAASLSLTARAATMARGALGLLGGPAGVIMLAVSAVAAWQMTSDDASASTENWSEKLKTLKGDLKAVRGQELENDLARANQRVEELSRGQSAWTIAGELVTGKKSSARIAAEKELDDLRAYQRGVREELDKLNRTVSDSSPARLTGRPGGNDKKKKPEKEDFFGTGKSRAQNEIDNYWSSRQYLDNQAAEKEKARVQALEEANREYAKSWYEVLTPLEKYNEALSTAQSYYNQTGDADLFARQVERASEQYNSTAAQREESDPAVEQQRAGVQAFIGLQESLTSQNDLIEQQYAQRAEIIRNALAQNWTDEATAQQAMTQLTRQYLAQRGDMEAKAALDRDTFDRASISGKVSFMAGKMNELVGTAGRHNKAMFQVQKASAIAEGLMGLRKSVMDAWTWGNRFGGPVVGAAMAGIAGAAQLANLNAIRSSQFSGGGSTGPGSSIGTFPANPVTGLPVNNKTTTNADTKPAQQVTIIVQGNMVDLSQLARELRPYNIQLTQDTV